MTWWDLVRLMDTCSVRSARGTYRSTDPDDPPEVTLSVVAQPPDRWRIETPGGFLQSLSDGRRVLEWDSPGGLPRQLPARVLNGPGPDAVLLLSALPAREWRSGDYHEPAGEPVRDVVLGRPCWRVDLLPPAHKQGLLSLWVDEATGARLRMANEDWGFVEEFVELELDVDLGPDAFSHDGPAQLAALQPPEGEPRTAGPAVMYHVSSSLNRQSILEHGLDWRRMGAARGIAGSLTPEQEGCFLTQDEWTRDWFVSMNNTGGPVDVWEVVGVAPGDLQESPEGYLFLPGVVGVERLRLLQTDLPPQHDGARG